MALAPAWLSNKLIACRLSAVPASVTAVPTAGEWNVALAPMAKESANTVIGPPAASSVVLPGVSTSTANGRTRPSTACCANTSPWSGMKNESAPNRKPAASMWTLVLSPKTSRAGWVLEPI